MSHNPSYPFNLPDLPPRIDLNKKIYTDLMLKARTELGELKGYSYAMPNPLLLLSPAVIYEAVASSDIENIHTTVAEVLRNQLFPESEQRQPDKEVLRYRDAVMWGYDTMKTLPISSRLILGLHQRLIPTSSCQYRATQNKIENAITKEIVYTPPVASDISRLMENWENFIHDDSDGIDPLLKCAIAHYQFEAIHPFGDGNGRSGRMLMVLYLIQEKLLTTPILFISGYINKNRNEYYRLLKEVSFKENWEEFIVFMLNGIYLQARQTKELLFSVMDLFFKYKDQVKKRNRKIYSADLVEALFSYPITTPVHLSEKMGIHYTTATRHLKSLSEAGLLEDDFYGKYHLYFNRQLLNILKQ